MSSDQANLGQSRPLHTSPSTNCDVPRSGSAPSISDHQPDQHHDGDEHAAQQTSGSNRTLYSHPRHTPQPAGPVEERPEALHNHQDPDFDQAHTSADNRPPRPEQARALVRLFQCRRCSIPYKSAYTLPCGRSICKTCLPQTHQRNSITYPASPLRMAAFQCPFYGCEKQHVLDDCSFDVVANKAASIFQDEMKVSREEAVASQVTTHVTVQDAWQIAGISSMHQKDSQPRAVHGGRLLATWTLAEQGELEYGAQVLYGKTLTSVAEQEPDKHDTNTIAAVQKAMRNEMDCQICYGLFIDPLTTGCGHTFCRSCLHRVLDHSRCCPICRRTLSINALLKRTSCPPNYFISHLVETFWSGELNARKELLAAESASRQSDFNVPLFVCTLAFPCMPTFLHIFEPRYRLMIRRALEGDKTFGMVLPKSPRHSDDSGFCELGTLLRIVNAQFYPDGRSLIETVGLTRFRVVRYGLLDGYTVAQTERVDDVSLEEEEALEAAEVGYDPDPDTTVSTTLVVMEDNDSGFQTREEEVESPATDSGRRTRSAGLGHQSQEGRPLTVEDLNTMTTQSLIRFTIDFVMRMREQSARWMTDRMLAIYGECPQDPMIFPWWFASTLPVKEWEKYRLLATSSVRERFKICALWILEIQRSHW